MVGVRETVLRDKMVKARSQGLEVHVKDLGLLKIMENHEKILNKESVRIRSGF